MGNPDSVSPILLTNFVTSNHSPNVSATATIKQPISRPGIVECRASNSEGVSYAVASLFLDNFFHPNRVESSLNNNTQLDPLQFTIISPIGTINESSTVHLECKATYYEFSYKFNFKYDDTFLSVNGTLQDDFWVTNIKITGPRGKLVTCIAQHKNGTELGKQIILPVELTVIQELGTVANERDSFSLFKVLVDVTINIIFFIYFLNTSAIVCLLCYFWLEWIHLKLLKSKPNILSLLSKELADQEYSQTAQLQSCRLDTESIS
uniref:Ig-like domain-containing protein n=1 Tax=Anopheles atroparvus TaxID=41427 RepID=A0AAG5D5V0_ANOAO